MSDLTDPAPDAPQAAEPDTKDWTWVLEQPCPECGFDAASVTGADVADLVAGPVERFQVALQSPSAGVRPRPQTWSVLEYACHVRDVCDVFGERVQLMTDEDGPTFANWDQDETALASRYWAQDPAVVAAQLQCSAAAVADRFRGVTTDQWQRPGYRSTGSAFTVDSLGRYFLHDLVHHVHDIDT